MLSDLKDLMKEYLPSKSDIAFAHEYMNWIITRLFFIVILLVVAIVGVTAWFSFKGWYPLNAYVAIALIPLIYFLALRPAVLAGIVMVGAVKKFPGINDVFGKVPEMVEEISNILSKWMKGVSQVVIGLAVFCMFSSVLEFDKLGIYLGVFFLAMFVAIFSDYAWGISSKFVKPFCYHAAFGLVIIGILYAIPKQVYVSTIGVYPFEFASFLKTNDTAVKIEDKKLSHIVNEKDLVLKMYEAYVDACGYTEVKSIIVDDGRNNGETCNNNSVIVSFVSDSKGRKVKQVAWDGKRAELAKLEEAYKRYMKEMKDRSLLNKASEMVKDVAGAVSETASATVGAISSFSLFGENDESCPGGRDCGKNSNGIVVYPPGEYTFTLQAGETLDHWIMIPPGKHSLSLSSEDYEYVVIYFDGFEIKDGPNVVYPRRVRYKVKIRALGKNEKIKLIVV